MALEKFKVKKGLEVTGSQTVAGELTQEASSASGYPFITSGTIALWPSSVVPDGWAECNGQELLIGSEGTQYNTLYKALTNNGATFPFGNNTDGSGSSGSTHFRLPDLRGRVAVGSGTGTGLTTRTLGGWGGGNTVAVTNDIISHQHNMPHVHAIPHTHTTPEHNGSPHASFSHTHSIGSHEHFFPDVPDTDHNHQGFFGNTGGPGTAFRMQSSASSPARNTDASGDHSHPMGAPSAGGIGDVFNDNDTSGASSSEATGAGGGNTGGPSQAGTTPHSGSTSTISLVQTSYSLIYVIKA
jgi:microcystin-dependent protein